MNFMEILWRLWRNFLEIMGKFLPNFGAISAKLWGKLATEIQMPQKHSPQTGCNNNLVDVVGFGCGKIAFGHGLRSRRRVSFLSKLSVGSQMEIVR